MADQPSLSHAMDELQYTLQSFKAIEQLLLDQSPALAALLSTVNAAVMARVADVNAAMSVHCSVR